jgi:deoxyguanosine kinase
MSRNLVQCIRVEIAGGIGAGKTSLARILRSGGMGCILEDFRKNPFVSAFYKRPALFALETEITFALQHYHALKAYSKRTRTVVLDHSFYLDEAYADVTLPDHHRRVHQEVVDAIRSQLGPQVLLVHLDCPADIQLRRIRARRRVMEQGIKTSYLESVNEALNRRLIAQRPNALLRIDSGTLDYVHDSASRSAVRKTIARWLANAHLS